MATSRMRALNRLNHLKAARLKMPGIYEDGGGLRLVVSDSLTKRWVMRVTINGKRRERGLGSFPTVSLEDARERAAALRKAARQGRDLARGERRLRASAGITFAAAFEAYFKNKQLTLSNGKHVAQWRSTMQRYVMPKIGAASVAEVDAEAILEVLAPIWFEKPETARRVLQRMEAVFRSAILRGHRKLALHRRRRGARHASSPRQPSRSPCLARGAPLHPAVAGTAGDAGDTLGARVPDPDRRAQRRGAWCALDRDGSRCA